MSSMTTRGPSGAHPKRFPDAKRLEWKWNNKFAVVKTHQANRKGILVEWQRRRRWLAWMQHLSLIEEIDLEPVVPLRRDNAVVSWGLRFPKSNRTQPNNRISLPHHYSPNPSIDAWSLISDIYASRIIPLHTIWNDQRSNSCQRYSICNVPLDSLR